MPIAQTQRLAISYQQSGIGPDVVMVHGLAANLAFWYLKIVPHFTPHYRVTAYDLRGHGRSEMPPTGYTTRDLAEDLIALLDERGIEKAHLVGHSIGGSVCVHAAVLHPERVASLTLVECRLHAFQPLLNRDNEGFWAKHGPELEARGITIPKNTPKVFYALIQELTPLADKGFVNPNAIPGLSGGPLDAKSRAGQRWVKLITETTFPGDLQETAGLTADKITAIPHPCLLMYGSRSNFMGTCEALTQALPAAKAHIFADRGHFFPVTEPNLISHHTLDFLAQLPA
ncbi:MAG TPA: alpha/beta hydrolase [Kiritimatiellia bacterium]|nr:alpha/beta hydrolase [Kiritimatiellia bacterium]HMP33814.1 alpha/beta hydrolase [Kiritimatiellia bacterium]